MRKLIYFIILTAAFLLVVGCRSNTPRYVPIDNINSSKEKEKSRIKDSIRIIEQTNIKDSIRIKDSTVYKVNDKGDIISKEVYQWKERYRENNYLLNQLQIKYDSLLQVKQDSTGVEVPYPVIEYKEVNRLKQWQIILMILGGCLIGYFVFRLVRLFK